MKALPIFFVVFCLFRGAFCMEDVNRGEDNPWLDYEKTLIKPESKKNNLDNSSRMIAFMKHSQYRAYETFDFLEQDLPSSIDFRNFSLCPPIYNQEQLESCTANSGASAVWYLLLQRDSSTAFDPSRLFLYYNERELKKEIRHSPNPITDNGATEIDIILALQKYGICPEVMWPYNEDMCDQRPSEDCYPAALAVVDGGTMVHSFVPRDLTKIKAVLSQKIPIVFGLAIYTSSITPYAWRTGIISTPTNIPNDTLWGYHSMMFIGYDDNMVGRDGNQGYFIFQNSWGEKFGDKGYGYLPYDYVMNPQLVQGRFFIKDIVSDLK